MRCAATVENKLAITWRARPNPDPQCLREAKIGDVCTQHAALRYCAAPGCHERALKREGRWWFCRVHAPMWREHNRIVDRILSIPARD